MTLRGNTLLVALLAGSLIGLVACGDDETSTTTTTSSTSSGSGQGGGGTGGGGTGGSATGGGGQGGMGPDCNTLCGQLFDCGLEMSGGGGAGGSTQLCPGFASSSGQGGSPGVTKALFVGDSTGGCVMSCEGGKKALLTGIVKPDMCVTTIDLAKMDTSFQNVCEGM